MLHATFQQPNAWVAIPVHQLSRYRYFQTVICTEPLAFMSVYYNTYRFAALASNVHVLRLIKVG